MQNLYRPKTLSGDVGALPKSFNECQAKTLLRIKLIKTLLISGNSTPEELKKLLQEFQGISTNPQPIFPGIKSLIHVENDVFMVTGTDEVVHLFTLENAGLLRTIGKGLYSVYLADEATWQWPIKKKGDSMLKKLVPENVYMEIRGNLREVLKTVRVITTANPKLTVTIV